MSGVPIKAAPTKAAREARAAQVVSLAPTREGLTLEARRAREGLKAARGVMIKGAPAARASSLPRCARIRTLRNARA